MRRAAAGAIGVRRAVEAGGLRRVAVVEAVLRRAAAAVVDGVHRVEVGNGVDLL